MPMFDVNSAFLYAVAGLVVLFVIAQSAFFLVKAWRRARLKGFEANALRRIIASSAVFTIAPAISILLGVITLSKFLGLPLPWLRLSVVGALTYELPAASAAAAATATDISKSVTNPQAFATIAWVMTLGIIPGLIIIPIFLKKIQGGILRLHTHNSKWGEAFMSALFIGMISAFLGMVFSDLRAGLPGFIPVFVMLSSALIMGVCGFFIKRYHVGWLENYALPLSMLGAMALSIPITNWIA